MTKMEATRRQVFNFRGIREKVEKYSRTSHICQLSKEKEKKYVHLPPTEVEEAILWKRILYIDIKRPYTMKRI